jgi:hypothetical protein
MSLAFNILDETKTTHTHTLDALCGHLSATVVAPFLRSQGVYWDPRFEQYFLHHADSDPFAATGTIEFYPPPMFLGQLGQLEAAIQAELTSLGIKTGPSVPRHYPDGLAVKVIEIPILTNPTVLSGPPEVSMASNSGRLVLSSVLGYQPANGRYEFTADDLLRRVDGVTEERIERQSTAPVCDRDEPQPRHVKPTTSAVTIHRIRRCLSELRALGEWAKANDYQRIEATPAKKN